tara:strand:+ start:4679 stop:5866 length:1188 start_codon:yes stop_codon:yes gene_type:complete
MKLIITIIVGLLQVSMVCYGQEKFDLISLEKERILNLASKYKNTKPITITDFICDRSAGNSHDFYSEGDYWWPDPENPNGPYIRKDGLTNPANFTAHRKVMIQFSQISGALASAYIITKNEDYVKQLAPHLQAWFINKKTKMNPNLMHGQAIMGRVTGRGIGIIDTIHLMEVALAVKAVENSKAISKKDIKTIKKWFESYLKWLTTHPFGIAERDNGNNHSVCWAMQVAVFAELTNDEEIKTYCRTMYKNDLLPNQMDKDGSFPKELSRTKPYGYSLFNLDVMSALCQMLTTPEDNLFTYITVDNKGMSLGLSFLYPYIKDKNKWPYKQDVMYWDEWPAKHPSLLFVGLALNKDSYLELWKSLPSGMKKQEVIRNMPIRFPLLWIKADNYVRVNR